MALKVQVSLLRCGKCGKPFTPFKAHVCNGRRSGRTTVKPGVSITSPCPSCGKQRSNPFTHTCQVGTDFKARKQRADRHAVAERKRAQARATRERQREREAARRKAAADRRRARQKAATAARREREAAKRRAAADKRRAAAAAKRSGALRPTRPPHDYHTCIDPQCHRYACMAWKEAFQEGRTTGLDDGYEQGYEAGRTAS